MPNRHLGEEVLVLAPSDGQPRLLNATAAEIWSLLENWHHAEDITATLGGRYRAQTDSELASAVIEVLDRLERDGLVEREPTG